MSLDVPELSSLPGANHTIYLDFDGHVTEGTSWNSYFNNPSIRSPAYSTDGDTANFSASELTDIEQAWQRVAEDFLPFAVNVTTVNPGLEALRKTSGSDPQWGVRIVITADTERSGAGGIAYIDSFNWSSDTPAFVYVTSGKYVAEAASHEIGHTLGLAHDGQSGSEYYYGHGSGATSWAPLMGAGYYAEVTQWDRGEYSGATNGGANANYGKGPSDLAVITSYNGFGYRADDHGNSTAQASALGTSGGTVSGGGVIGGSQDADVFAFLTGAGDVTLNVTPAALGANLDVRADLLDGTGNVIASSNPAGGLGASLAANLPAGTYYLRIDGVGVGNPAANPPTGYSDYGSIGQYTISGQVVDAGGLASLAVGDVTISESAALATFSVTLTGTISEPITVDFLTVDDTAAAGADYAATQGTLTFLPGAVTSQAISVPIIGDSAYEGVERFFLRLQNASPGALIADSQGVGTINDDDIALSISNWSTREGTPNRGKKSSEVQFTPFTFTVSLSGPSVTPVAVRYDTQNGTALAATDFSASGGTVTFAPGETAKTVTVNVIADATAEPDEGFKVVLSTPVGADLADAIGDGTIVDDDSKGKPAKSSTVKPASSPKLTSPKRPVRDVFTWQGTANQAHMHGDEEGRHQESDLIWTVALALTDRPIDRSAVSETDLPVEQTFALDDWIQTARPAQPPPGPDSLLDCGLPGGLANEDEGDRVAADDADWLELLASDRHALKSGNPVGI
jgi:hypothetical protein